MGWGSSSKDSTKILEKDPNLDQKASIDHWKGMNILVEQDKTKTEERDETIKVDKMIVKGEEGKQAKHKENQDKITKKSKWLEEEKISLKTSIDNNK